MCKQGLKFLCISDIKCILISVGEHLKVRCIFSGQQDAVKTGAADATEYVVVTLPPGCEAVPQYSNQYSISHRTGRRVVLRIAVQFCCVIYCSFSTVKPRSVNCSNIQSGWRNKVPICLD